MLTRVANSLHDPQNPQNPQNPQDATFRAPARSLVFEISETFDVWVLESEVSDDDFILDPDECVLLLIFVSVGTILHSVIFLWALTQR